MRAIFGLRSLPSVRRAPHRRRGGAVAEFAISLPVMVLLLLGTVEYGYYFSEYAQVVAAARDAARFGSNQETLQQARTQAMFAARTVLTDMGFSCGLSSPGCMVDAQILQQDDLNFVEVTIILDYNELTGAIPRGGLTAIPTQHRVRAVYPVVGVR